MRTASEYEFECLCGKSMTSQTTDVVCPSCGARIRLDWAGEGQLSVASGQLSDHDEPKHVQP